MNGIRLATLGLVLAVSSGCSLARVGSGEVGVVRTPSGVESKVYPTGDWRIGIWDTPTNYSVRSQEREERLEVGLERLAGRSRHVDPLPHRP